MEQQRAKYVIPVGYVFRPEPEELLGFLVESIKLGDQWIGPPEIRNLHLYDKDSNPWTLFDGSSEKPCYVMTRLERKVTGKSKFKRTAGAGTWKEQKSSDVEFRCQDGVKLKGLKRYFAFVPNKGSGYSSKDHGRWIMNEYSLPQGGFDDYVICEIHKKASKRKHDDDDDDDDDTIQNRVVMKKMRSSTTTCATSDHVGGDGVVTVEAVYDEHCKKILDFLMEDDIVPSTPAHDQEVVEGGVNDIVACDSLATGFDSDHDRRGMISIQSVNPFEGHDHHYPSSSSYDHNLDSIVKTDSCVPRIQSYPPLQDDFRDFPAFLPMHCKESATSTRDHRDNCLGSVIVDGSDDSILFEGLGF